MPTISGIQPQVVWTKAKSPFVVGALAPEPFVVGAKVPEPLVVGALAFPVRWGRVYINCGW
ncbi:hypothetical protein [Microseira wollei]|uniref:hypothetical protein n=1 Tax=Microseira wollei TaxID=467598 RepID=UPI001CFC98A3|nr:hypothetical protein [Microseira wollei]